jgi:hypothetical protein
MTRHLHSFTLTPAAHYEVKRMERGKRSLRVSECIVKYGNDYHLTPEGVKYWQDISNLYLIQRDEATRALARLRSSMGVKHHLRELLRCLNPFRRQKRE